MDKRKHPFVERRQRPLGRRKIDQEIFESEQHYRLLFNSNPNPMWVFDLETLQFLAVNEAAIQHYGYSREEFLQMTVKEVRLAEDVQAALRFGTEMLEKHKHALGPIPEGTWRHKKKDGTLIWVEACASRFTIEGKPAVLVLIIDITERKQAEETVRQSQKNYQNLVDSIEGIVYETNTSFENPQIYFVSHQVEKILGYSTDRWRNEPSLWFERIHPEDRARVMAQSLNALKTGTAYDIEYRMRNSRDRIVWVRDLFHVVIEHGIPLKVQGIMIDITHQKETEQALQLSEKRYRVLFESNLAGVFQSTLTGKIIDCNQAFAHILGYASREEIMSRDAFELYFSREQREAFVQVLLSQGYVADYEICVKRKDGSPVWLIENVSLIENPRENTLIQGTIVNITSRKEAEAQLSHYTHQLQALSRRLVEVQEVERRHLARELHDEIGQLLSALKMSLQINAENASSLKLDKSYALLNDLLDRVRQLSLDLRPAILDDLGLLPALLWHFDRYQDQGVHILFKHSGIEGRRFTSTIETAAYRIIQEALTNVARHAHIREVVVRAWATETMLGVQIEDHGSGFELEAALAGGKTGGLTGMRERATLLGGQLIIESRPGAGTYITAEFPLQSESGGME